MAKQGRDDDPVTRAEVLASRGNFQIKNWKGRVYVSKWPRKRGNQKTNLQQAWVNHFSCVAKLSRYPDPRTFDAATDYTKRTGWYYRDAIAAAAVGKLIRYEGIKRITTPTAFVHRNVSEALTSGVAKVLTPNVPDWDNNQFWSLSINPQRLTIKATGLYMFGGRIQFSSKAGSTRRGQILLNGTQQLAINRVWPGTAVASWVELSSIWYFHEDDYITIDAYVETTAIDATLMGFWMVAITPEAIL